MLGIVDLKALTSWCIANAMRWRPVLRAGSVAVVLEPIDARQCWGRVVLTQIEDDYELMTEAGELLAVASEVQSVLDALKGGVAEPSPYCAPPVLAGSANLQSAATVL